MAQHVIPLGLSLRTAVLCCCSAVATAFSVTASAQQPAPPGSDLAVFAAKRFPQPVRVGDLLRRPVLEPMESRPLLGHVVNVVRLPNEQLAIVMTYGGFWGLDARAIAVPADGMVLLGRELEVLDFTPAQLRTFPTFEAGGGTVLGADEVIHMGLAHPSH